MRPRGPALVAALAALAALAPALKPRPAAAFWLGAKADCKGTTRAPEIDGKPDDWTLEPDDERDGLAYGCARDERYLYVIFVPHTREAREQLGGLYLQDLMLWLDPSAGKTRLSGLKALAPAQLGETARALEPVRVSTAAAAPAEAAVAVGPMEGRGALEARLPLAWLGSAAPKRFTLGLEALTPRRPPAVPAPPRSRDAREAPAAPKFETLSLWVRLDLAR